MSINKSVLGKNLGKKRKKRREEAGGGIEKLKLCNSGGKRRGRGDRDRSVSYGLTIVVELLLGGAESIRGREEAPGWKAHLQLRPLSHLDRRSSP